MFVKIKNGNAIKLSFVDGPKINDVFRYLPE